MGVQPMNDRLDRNFYQQCRLAIARVNRVHTAALAAARRKTPEGPNRRRPDRPAWLLGAVQQASRRRGGAEVQTKDGVEVVPDGTLRSMWELCTAKKRSGFLFDRRGA